MNTARSSLLFISYWVPPRKGIGSVRSAHLLGHLAKFGWDVTAVTAPFDNTTRAESLRYVLTGYLDLKGSVKRALGVGNRSTHEALNVRVPAYGSSRNALQRAIFAAASLVMYPDEHIGWVPFLASTVRRITAKQKFDAILTSAPPVTTNLAAALAHRSIPWVADMRDLWAENDSIDRSPWRMHFDDKLERLCLSHAAAITASSELSGMRFARRYPDRPVFPISTGFNAQEWEHVPFGSERQCTLVYAGTLYWGKRDPSTLFAALRRIFDEGSARRDELRVDFYSAREPWLLELVARFDLGEVVRILGFSERETVLAAERRANRLVVLSWDGPTAEGVVAGKLFEYFGARRPVLAIGGPELSGVEDLLRETNAGVRTRTVEQTKAEVLKALIEHRNGLQRTVPQDAVRAYTGEACARRFAEVLDYVVREGLAARQSATVPMPAKTAKNGIAGK